MEKIIDLKKFWQDKSVLITGHTGFKGIWFSVFLNLLGAKVYGYALKAKKKSLFRLINTKKIYKKSFIGDIKNFEVGNKKLLKLGFEFEHLDFNKALKETFDWYKTNLNIL